MMRAVKYVARHHGTSSNILFYPHTPTGLQCSYLIVSLVHVDW
jgi:hypothetical protein